MTRMALRLLADDCNRAAGFACIPERDRKGRMMFLRQYDRQEGLCALCGHWFAPAEMTRDHVVPRAQGGGPGWDNIQLACGPCNEGKGAKKPLDTTPPIWERGGMTTSDTRQGGRCDQEQ
jgi:5-methylcytosine-specific restriction endonuclease McrA